MKTPTSPRLWLKGLIACALAMLALGTGRANAANASVTAIDILLEPDATTLQHATATNERLLKDFPKGFALDAPDRSHITLVQRFVFTENLDKVHAVVAKFFATANVTDQKLEAFKYFYILDKDLGLWGIVIKPTPELPKLEERVIDAVTPLAVTTGTSAAFATTPEDAGILPALITYVSEFVPNHSGKNIIRTSPQASPRLNQIAWRHETSRYELSIKNTLCNLHYK